MSDSRRQQIIESSFGILLNEGINKLTIKNIAKKMGFVESAVYKHYSSKNEILNDIISHVETECENVLSKLESSNDDDITKIYLYFTEWNMVYTKKPYIIPILFSKEIFKFSLEFSLSIQSMIKRQMDALESIIASGQKIGIFPDNINVVYLRLILTSPWIIMIDNWFYNGRKFSLEDESKKLINEIIKLLK